MKLLREYATHVCNLFAQLGARGVSVLFASGDRRRRQELRDQEPFRPVHAQISHNLYVCFQSDSQNQQMLSTVFYDPENFWN